MRLLFLGPATIHLSTWLDEFARAGATVRMVTLHEPQFTGSRIVDLSSPFPISINLLGRMSAIRKEIASWRPDVLVAYYASSYGLAARLSGFRPYVVVTAGSDINLSFKRRAHLMPFVRCALSGASGVVCWSETMQAAVERFTVPARILVQPRGVLTDRFRRSDATQGATDVPQIVCLRRFSKLFNHRTLIETCRILVEQGVRFHLNLCDDGPERAAIECLVMSHGLTDHISFLGKLSSEQVANVLAGCQLYVALAETDGASASLFEALSAGAFPIVSDIAANRLWITDGVNGLLVDSKDSTMLASAIQRALGDTSLLQNAARQNRQLAEQSLDIRANTRKFLDFFQDVGAAARPIC